MKLFDTHTIESASAPSANLLTSIEKKYGFIPNLLATMAESPELLEGYATLVGILAKSDLSETEQQIVMMTNNRLNGCGYCMAAHSTLSKMSGIDSNVINALRDGTPINDAKLEALHVFSAVINQSKGNPTKEQIDAFLGAGYSKRTILEVVLATSIKVMSNYTNHIADTEVDDAFSENTWSA